MNDKIEDDRIRREVLKLNPLGSKMCFMHLKYILRGRNQWCLCLQYFFLLFIFSVPLTTFIDFILNVRYSLYE